MPVSCTVCLRLVLFEVPLVFLGSYFGFRREAGFALGCAGCGMRCQFHKAHGLTVQVLHGPFRTGLRGVFVHQSRASRAFPNIPGYPGAWPECPMRSLCAVPSQSLG